MKKVILLLLISTGLFAQDYAARYYSQAKVDTNQFCPEYLAVLAYADSNGIKLPSDNVKEAQDQLMRGLVSKGIYAALRDRKFGAFYNFKADTSLTSDFAGINWIDTSKYNGTPINALTIVPYVGMRSATDTSYYDIDMNFWASDTSEFYNDFGFGGYYEGGQTSDINVLYGGYTSAATEDDQRLEMFEQFVAGSERFYAQIGGSNNSPRFQARISDIVADYPYLLSVVQSQDSTIAFINDETNLGNANFFRVSDNSTFKARQGEIALFARLTTTHATGDTANILSKTISNTLIDTVAMAYFGVNMRPYISDLDSMFTVYRSEINALNDTINPFSQTFFPNTSLNTTLPALPRNTASFGMVTSGGSGRATAENTTIWTVTNSNLEGAGSFVDMLDSADLDGTPSIIVFSSTVCFDTTFFNSITIGQDDLTIYGQTAPTGGVRFHGRQLVVRGNNIVFQHVRYSAGTDSLQGVSPIYPISFEGNTQFDERDAVKVVGDSIVFDHCTFNFGTDELVQTTGNNITFNYCLFTKPLSFYEVFIDGPDTTFTGHSKKAHPKGLIMFKQDVAKGQNLCINRCLFISNVDRNPQVGGQARILIQENVVFNAEWGIAGVYGQPEIDDTLNGGFPLMTVTKNQIEQITKGPLRLETKGFPTAGAVWLDSNFLDGGLANFTIPAGYSAASRLDSLLGTNFVPTYKLKKYLSAHVGARPQDRDTVEKTAINEFVRGLKVSPPQNMDFWRPLLNATIINTTTLNIPSNPNTLDSSGYKRIEVWADSLHWRVTYPDSIPYPHIEADPTGAFLFDVENVFLKPHIEPRRKETIYKEVS